MNVDGLIERPHSPAFDPEFAGATREQVATALQLLKSRYALFLGFGREGCRLRYHSGWPTREDAVRVGAVRLDRGDAEAQVIDTMDGTVVWTQDDSDRAAGMIAISQSNQRHTSC